MIFFFDFFGKNNKMKDLEVFKIIQRNTGIKHILPGTLHVTNIEGKDEDDSYMNYRNMFIKRMSCPFCKEDKIRPEECVLVKVVFKRNKRCYKHPFFHRNMTRAHYSCVQGEMCYCNAILNGECEFCAMNPRLSQIVKSKKDNFFYTV